MLTACIVLLILWALDPKGLRKWIRNPRQAARDSYAAVRHPVRHVRKLRAEVAELKAQTRKLRAETEALKARNEHREKVLAVVRTYTKRFSNGDWRTWDVAEEVAVECNVDLSVVFEACEEIDSWDEGLSIPVMRMLRQRHAD